MVAVALACSRNRKAISWKPVVWGIVLQLGLGIIVLKTSLGSTFFSWVNDGVVQLLSFQQEGAAMVFNTLAVPPDQAGSMGFFFAFQVLTTIVFLSALISVLYHFGVMQWIMRILAKVMRRLMGTSGAESLSASANIFLGQTEAPLMIRPYLKGMTQSELLCVMVAGMATVATAALGAYVGLLKDHLDGVAGHLLAASLMSAPAAIAISKILLPETEEPATAGGGACMDAGEKNANVLEAAASGAQTGMTMAINIATMLIAFMALLALLNGILGWGMGILGFEGVTLQGILGYLCAPLAWAMGAPWEECFAVGALIGEKTTLNEFVAYMHMAEGLTTGAVPLSERSTIIAVYALSGFSNLMSIGIQIGGIGSIVPERKSDLARLGVLALIGGSLACFMTACIAGLLV